MYRPTDRQTNLFVAGFQLHPSVRKMLERSWASGFRCHILPLLLRLEHLLSPLYDADTGRPNWSAARMMGLCLIQAWFDLTDRELEQQLAFDIRVQHALDLPQDEAYLSRRSLSDFRLRLVVTDPDGEVLREVFDAVAKEAIEHLGVDISRQRLDSTHVMSNIRTRGRADLFACTLRRFVDQLQHEYPEGLTRLPEELKRWHESDEETKWFGKGGKRTGLRRLAQWAVDVCFSFSDEERVLPWESYSLVTRLVDEYCVFVDEDSMQAGDEEKVAVCAPVQERTPVATQPTESVSAGDEGHEQNLGTAPSTSRSDRVEREEEVASVPEKGTDVKGCDERREASGDASSTQADPKRSQSIPVVKDVLTLGRCGGNSLQSPHDPDAGYGHKGVGYSVHITETCGNAELPEIITDFEVRSGADNDWGKSTAVVERLSERELAPGTLFADAGYPTPKAILEAEQSGIDLHAPVSRPAGTDAVGLEEFQFDQDGRVVACPAGHAPTHHDVRREPGCDEPELHAYFDGNTCRSCPLHGRCTARGLKTGRYRVRIEPRLIARDLAIVRQQEPAWWNDYSIRSGVEATMSELKRPHGLGRLRVRRTVRVLMNVSLKVTACNIKRWVFGMEAYAPA